MITKIENIFDKIEGYNCFACGPHHPFGLHLEFFYDSEKDEVFSPLHLDTFFAGFPGIVHGGIQTTILDELAFWGIWVKWGKTGFTYDLNVKFKKKCPIEKEIEGRATFGNPEKRLTTCNTVIWNPVTKEIYTEGCIRYYLPPQDPRR